jgi:DNA-directed RNA polymerase subunit M/transcription elongation factor TFIIS
MAKHHDNAVAEVNTADNTDAKEQARAQIAALLAQFGSSIVPVTVAAERIETAKVENAGEIAALQARNTELRAQIDPLNAEIKENVGKILALTGRKSITNPATGGRTRKESKCPECGQGRHSYWKNKAKGERNMVTANCATFQKLQAARAATSGAPMQTEFAQ